MAVEVKYAVTASTEEASSGYCPFQGLERKPIDDPDTLAMIWDMTLDAALEDEERLRQRVLTALTKTHGEALATRQSAVAAAMANTNDRVGVVLVASKIPHDPFGALLSGGGAFLNGVRADTGATVWLEPRASRDRVLANIAAARILLISADSPEPVKDALKWITPKLAAEAIRVAALSASPSRPAPALECSPVRPATAPAAPPTHLPAPASPPPRQSPAPAASPPPISPTLTPSKRPSPGGGTPISPEQRERIKRNKAEAERKLAAARARRTSAVKSAYERPAFCYDST